MIKVGTAQLWVNDDCLASYEELRARGVEIRLTRSV
jgi:hypothetical protein